MNARDIKIASVIRWALLVSVFFLFVYVLVGIFVGYGHKKSEVLYTCPMHPSYISKQGGDCPVCGMRLVPVGVKENHATKADIMEKTESINTYSEKTYVCPMHPEITSGSESRCPICNMKLIVSDDNFLHSESQMIEHTESRSYVDSPRADADVHLPLNRLNTIGVTYVDVVEMKISPEIKTYGFISFDDTKKTKIHIRTSGFVDSVYKSENDYVVKGERLLRLYSPEIYQAKEEYVSILKNFQNHGDNHNLLGISEKKLSLLGVGDKEMMRLRTEKMASEFTDIVSETSGYIIRKFVYEKQFISETTELFEIVDNKTVYLNINIFAGDVERVKIGDDAVFYPQGSDQLVIKGRINFINPYFDTNTRLVRARAILRNDKNLLRDGMFGKVSILLSDKTALFVPRDAVVFTGDKDYVFVVKGTGIFEKREVRVGVRYNDYYEIKEGVQKGEKVVLNGNFLIDSESSIQSAFKKASDRR